MSRPASRPHGWLLGLLLVVLIALAYTPVWEAGFVWDDDDHLTNNPCIVGPLGFADIWTTSRAVYYPLVLTSFWALHKVAGLDPFPYHLLNVMMHAASALVLWRVLKALKARGAWLAAALWGLHPVMVQSVAWITELKNTQSAFFFLLAILAFLTADNALERHARRRVLFALSLVLFALALASKPSTVVLPAVLALCLWWRHRRLRGGDLIRLAPFFCLALAASVWTIWEQKFHSGALGAEWMQTWPERIAIAGRDIWFYLGKLVWPEPLIFIYPRWEIAAHSAIAFLPTAAAIAGLVFLWWKRRGPLRPVLFAAAYLVVALAPVLGFFSVYFFRYSFVSDHFQYLAAMGPLALLAAGLARGLDFFGDEGRAFQPAIAVPLLLLLGALTFRQTLAYDDAETLYRRTLQLNPACWMAEGNLAGLLVEKGGLDEAIGHYEKAVALWPGHAEAHNNLANAYLRKGELDQALLHFQKVVGIWPNELEAWNNIGGILLQQGRIEEAIAEFEKVIRLNPQQARAQNNLGNALLQAGRIDEAIGHYEKTLALPFDLAEAHYNLGNAFLQKGDFAQAIAHYREALARRPDHANTHNNLGNALERQGHAAEAFAQYQKAVDLEPTSLLFQNNLAWMLATSEDASIRDPARAVEVAERTNQFSANENPMILHTLATAYAARERLPEAIATAERARQLAAAQNNRALSDALEKELALYRSRPAD